MTPNLAIIVPCFNEEEIIKDTISALNAAFKALVVEKVISENSFILFIDDGSSDNTLRLLKQNRTGNIKIVKLLEENF
ncbi:glycosyltransferase [Albibacterium profundi]|uniref:Glycosyltransferase n=1 Tax=Albibacterium profundi TaxID=3134906 RepID=A0ABV5CGD3_9SPHI